MDKDTGKGERAEVRPRLKARYKSGSPGKGTCNQRVTVLGPGHETCQGHVAGRLQRVVRRYPPVSQRHLALKLAPVGVIQCRGAQRRNLSPGDRRSIGALQVYEELTYTWENR